MEAVFQSRLEELLNEGRLDGCFPSAACSIGVRDELLAEAFIGDAPLPGDAPVNAHTRYDMASLSKVIGPTMIALRAIEDGCLSLNDTVGQVFPFAPEDKRGITVRMLMTHMGGLYPDFKLEQLITSPDDTLRCILEHPLMERPGTRPIYSCMGYILLTKMLEARFGKPLDELARERVFEPLGLRETGYCPIDCVCAATEVAKSTGEPWIGIVHDENARFQGGVSGNAGVFMSLGDAERFAAMLANMGGSYLKRETMLMAIRNHTPGQDEHRGLGFQIAGTPLCFFSDRVPDTCFGHTGFTGTSLMVEPESGFWVVLLTNRVYPTRETTKLFPFRRRLHGECWELFKAERMNRA